MTAPVAAPARRFRANLRADMYFFSVLLRSGDFHRRFCDFFVFFCAVAPRVCGANVDARRFQPGAPRQMGVETLSRPDRRVVDGAVGSCVILSPGVRRSTLRSARVLAKRCYVVCYQSLLRVSLVGASLGKGWFFLFFFASSLSVRHVFVLCLNEHPATRSTGVLFVLRRRRRRSSRRYSRYRGIREIFAQPTRGDIVRAVEGNLPYTAHTHAAATAAAPAAAPAAAAGR